MLLLGLLLMAASGAFAGLLIADNLSGGPEYQVTILGNGLATLDSLGIFLAGLGLALVFCLGLALMRLTRHPVRRGTRRTARRETYPVQPARRAEPVAPMAAPGESIAPPKERAAKQGGRADGASVEPARGTRRRHLFGH
ncbi:hypothetical protein ACFVXG_27745 [Kitasatospora sp. NPDC058162]|uniref:hypothetical protein n=1 Tax=Kitasatospora sp. NPDC058162 TaxID=3346362 RepID=UPI0036DC0100